MASEEKDQEKPKSKKTCWILGICILILVLIVGAIFIVRSISKTSQDEEDVKMSQADLVDYFVDLTTVYPGVDREMKVIKWEKSPVTVSIEDQAPGGGEEALSNFISTFNNNSTEVKLERVQKDGDIKIYFQTPISSAGSAGPSTGADFAIDNAKIVLSENAAMFQQSLDSVLSHEMFHTLGFTGHYSGSVCRLMSKSVCGSHMTENEEELIKMMYSGNLPSGSDKTQIRAFFQNQN
ncbi:hypothetical protein A2V71_00740 [Candidatus Berkelbacteria bacterium RBG_13_40_8]|uniref:Peptidase M10 metallopeptidase domain-containing protein n=1 Tax=Candidatus Berkelbacteria bacterium RBG_13_40_8 TaxID=1797467 RepID=A0A1F5DQC9_9BACT|nr:MAG: hypothetical protein A2V71_00740 [Candidatus Berkelbacteria bacterium RBG_13_40_8]